MSVFNVHVNRVPFSGKVWRIGYHPGNFVRADKNQASGSNEQNAVFLETEQGAEISFVQVAGMIARRIICRLQVNDPVVRGQRFGMICFGSRVDLYLPDSAEIAVAVGDRVIAGTSIMGYLR
jgi:phosphatidylserine decarboxylase